MGRLRRTSFHVTQELTVMRSTWQHLSSVIHALQATIVTGAQVSCFYLIDYLSFSRIQSVAIEKKKI